MCDLFHTSVISKNFYTSFRCVVCRVKLSKILHARDEYPPRFPLYLKYVEKKARWGIPSQVITLQANIIMRTLIKMAGSVAVLSIVATAAASAATLNLPAMSCSYSFNASMGIGSRGEMVRDLQKVLNMYPQTQVSASGAGSPGMETTTFGPATKAAVIKFQKLHPADTLATGYVGPLTRTLLNLVCTGSGTGTGTGSGTGTVTGTGVSVSSTSNAGGVIVAGAAQVPVLNFRVSNATGAAVTLNAVRFMKTGILSDSNISNAYLSMGNNIVAQYTGLSNGVLTFSNTGIVVGAGSSVDLSLRVDVSTGAPSSNIVAFQLASASDVTLSAGSIGGTFPLTGGNYYVSTVSNPSLAAVTLAYQAVATQVDAGTTGFRSGSLSMNVTNNPVKLQSVRFTVSGSINFASDLANLTLRVDGSPVATASSVMSDGKVYFDLGTGKLLSTGSHQLEVYADVLGTANRNYKFEILRPYDVVVMDTQYNTNIAVGTPSGSSTTVSVRQGTATMTLASDTPTGNVAIGGSNVTLAKFTMRASGEGLRIKFLPFKIVKAGGGNWAALSDVDADVRNIGLYSDDGTQIGSTINTPSTCAYTPSVSSNTTYLCSFGSSSSNINYLVAANTTRIFSIKADIQNTADITSIQAVMDQPGSNNVEGQISFQTSLVPSGLINGSTLTISSSPFQGSQNSSVGVQSYVPGANGVKIGSFSLSASSAEGINVTSVSIKTSAGVNASSSSFNVQNLTVKVDGTNWSFTVPTVSAATTYTFSAPSGTSLVSAGTSKIVDVYADLLSGSAAGTYVAPISLVDAVGTGASTNSSQTLKNSSGLAVSSNNVAGQNVTVAGTGTLTVGVDTSVPAARQLVLGSTNATLGQFRFTADNNEDIRLDQLTVTASSSVTSGPATFKNLTLWDGSTQVASGLSLTASTTTAFTSTFSIPSGSVIVPKNTTKVLTLKGDVATYSESPSSVAAAYSFRIAGAVDVRAFGNASNLQNSVTGSSAFPLASNIQTAVRTKVTATLAPSGATSARARTANDDIAKLTLTADSAYSAEFRTVTFTVSGAAAATTTFQLIDDATGVVVPGASASTNNGVVTLAPTNPEFITAGGNKVYRVRVDSSSFANAASTSDSYSIQVASTGNFGWREQGGSTNIGLEATAVPLTSTVSYE